jgi:DUF4097 and DUF4098 domain-containing protein YvlB
MISISALLWVFMGASAAFPDASEQFHKTYPLKEGTTVSVENVSGKIDVSVWDESYADVSAVKYTKRDKSELDKVSIEVSVNGSLTIKPEYRKNESKSSFFSRIFGQGNSCGAQVSVDFTIKLPRAAVLREVKSVSGDIALSGTRGDASVRSVSGAIRVKDTEGALELSAISGDIEVERGALKTVSSISGDIILRDIQGVMSVHSVSGDIRVERAMGVVEAHSTSGDMNVSADAVRSATSISGDIDISAGTVSDAMECSTISGDLRLRVPATTNADITMETVSGNLVNHSGLSISMLSGSKRSISGRIGAGGKTISVKTTSGDVFLEK